jgi:general nucleoside transport system permease protein
MAVPTTQREASRETSSTPRFLLWLHRYAAALSRPVFAVLLAILIGSVVILITSSGSIGDRFASISGAYAALWIGSFGSFSNAASTLVTVTPLIFASLSVAISFRAGLFNIGAAGQIVMGAMAADILAAKALAWPGWLLVPAMVLVSMLVGGIWGAIVGFLKAWRGAHEVVTTIMLNWIAFYLTDYLIDGPFTAPGGSNQTDALPVQAQLPKIVTLYNLTLGHFFPQLDPFVYPVDVGFLLALLAIIIYWFISRRTTFGYEIRVLGQNPKAAAYAGIPTKRNILLVMAIAGAFAGLGGALHLMGQFPYQMIATTSRTDPTGFDAIGASLLGQNTAIGVLLGSLLFGALRSSSSLMQASGIDGDIVLVLEALVLFCMASEFLPTLRRALPSWLRFSPRGSQMNEPFAVLATPLPGAGSLAEDTRLDNSEDSSGLKEE